MNEPTLQLICPNNMGGVIKESYFHNVAFVPVYLCFGPHSGYSQRRGAGVCDSGIAMKAAGEPQQPKSLNLGFVGAGMMATAMINGIIASKV